MRWQLIFLFCMFIISIAFVTRLTIAVAQSSVGLSSNGTVNYIPTQTLPVLHVDGAQIKDEKGNVIILRGVVYTSVQTWYNSNENQFEYIKNMGCNAVHIQVWMYQIYNNLVSWSDMLNWLDKAIAWATANDLYVILGGFHLSGSLPDHNPLNDIGYLFNGKYETFSGYLNRWQTLANRYKNYSNILYQLMGEPLNCNYETYTSYMQQTSDTIRATGGYNTNAICLIQPVNSQSDFAVDWWYRWGFWFQESYPINRNNIVFAFDPYGWMTYPNNDVSAIQSLYSHWHADYLVANNFCTLLAEVGPDNLQHTSSYTSWDKTWLYNTFGYVDSVGGGYMAWEWSTATADLLNNWNGGLTTYANDVKNYYLSH
jgi:aryl-phospho-beta-D-glucosidase BglC (GH1 family)